MISCNDLISLVVDLSPYDCTINTNKYLVRNNAHTLESIVNRNRVLVCPSISSSYHCPSNKTEV